MSEDTRPVVGVFERRDAERGRLMADVANAVVRIHKRFYGKGPTKARAHMHHDLLTVLLYGGYTRGEQTLHDHGYMRELMQARLAMQRSVEGEFRAAVETLLQRSVLSFMSANDPANDLQVEIFVMEPASEAQARDAEDHVADLPRRREEDQAYAEIAERTLAARITRNGVVSTHDALRPLRDEQRPGRRDEP
jgi:uncharacterized protein YbcI